jgi:ADP-ribose pyrophosphatase
VGPSRTLSVGRIRDSVQRPFVVPASAGKDRLKAVQQTPSSLAVHRIADAPAAQATLSRRTVFKGRVLQVDAIEIGLPGGRRGLREVVCHGGAAAVLGVRPDGRFVLVRQYRKAVEEELIEVIAGGIEPGERPETCAVREVGEETGYRVKRLESLGDIAACPGYSSERLHIFLAELSERPDAPRPDEDEGVSPVVLSRAEVEEGIAAGRIRDSKTLATWLLWKLCHAEA